MSEKLMHVPKIVTDDENECYFVECELCGKVLWYPYEECKPAKPAEPPALGINVSEPLGTADIFG